ncbi:Pyrophosphate--fructose 6-phosphate 1-phosphotransferase subunit beta 2, partial [Glycine soja]
MPVCVSSSVPSKVLDLEVAVNKEEYQVFDELGRGRLGTLFRCFQHRGLWRHQNGGLGGWWRGGGGCRQRGDRKEAAAGEEVIVVVVGEEVAECVDLVKKKELDSLRAEMPVALVEGDREAVFEPVRATVDGFGAERFPRAACKSEVEDWRGSIWWSGSRWSQYYLQDLVEGSTLYDFRGGPAGIMKCKYVELTSDYIYPYRNQVYFSISIETPEQFKQVEETVQKLDLDDLVVIGGDDSNTNACLLAKHFR